VGSSAGPIQFCTYDSGKGGGSAIPQPVDKGGHPAGLITWFLRRIRGIDLITLTAEESDKKSI